MTQPSELDPNKRPCPWCLAPIGYKDVKRWNGWNYCPKCSKCVVKYLSHSESESGTQYGWYWGKHQSHG